MKALEIAIGCVQTWLLALVLACLACDSFAVAEDIIGCLTLMRLVWLLALLVPNTCKLLLVNGATTVKTVMLDIEPICLLIATLSLSWNKAA